MTDQINDLIEQGNAWHAQAVALLADRQAHQQNYETLAGNLRGVVDDELSFRCTLDPTEVAPTLVRNGTFNTLDQIYARAPKGGQIEILLPAGANFDFSEVLANDLHMQFENTEVYIRSADLNNRATITFGNYEQGGYNLFERMNLASSILRMKGVDMILAQKAAAGGAFSGSYNGPIRSVGNFGIFGVIMENCTIDGPSEAAFIVVNGSNVQVSVIDSTLSGGFDLMSGMSSGVATLATRNVTLAGGSSLTDGTETVGVNFLKN